MSVLFITYMMYELDEFDFLGVMLIGIRIVKYDMYLRTSYLIFIYVYELNMFDLV